MYVRDPRIEKSSSNADNWRKVVRRHAGSTYPVYGIFGEDASPQLLNFTKTETVEWTWLGVLLTGA